MTKDYTPKDMKMIVKEVLDGKVIAFPTDTVYGVGVRYDDTSAIERLKWVKGRPEDKPFPMMVSSVTQLEKVAWLDVNIIKIINKFTPGALTLVLNKKDNVSDVVTNGKSTIAVRIPDDRFVLDLIDAVGIPLLVTSANLSNKPSCTTFDEVINDLDGRIDGIVDGVCGSGVASTILDVTSYPFKILRQGDITLEQIMEVIN